MLQSVLDQTGLKNPGNQRRFAANRSALADASGVTVEVIGAVLCETVVIEELITAPVD